MTLEQRMQRAIRIMCNLISFYLFLGLCFGGAMLVTFALALSGAVEWE